MACAPPSTTSPCPLDHFGRPAATATPAETITVFAREYVSTAHTEAEAEDLPWLLFLQGGPGGRGNRLASLGGWSKAAARDFRILMLDQRGTGLSTPVDRNTLPLRGTAEAQAAYLEHFRADSIVADAELIRDSPRLRPLEHLRAKLRRILRPDLPFLRAGGAARKP